MPILLSITSLPYTLPSIVNRLNCCNSSIHFWPPYLWTRAICKHSSNQAPSTPAALPLFILPKAFTTSSPFNKSFVETLYLCMSLHSKHSTNATLPSNISKSSKILTLSVFHLFCACYQLPIYSLHWCSNLHSILSSQGKLWKVCGALFAYIHYPVIMRENLRPYP